MLTIDGTDFPKQGKASCGVARQHCGPKGKVDNCQASVFLGFTGKFGYGLLDYAMFMPQQWFQPEYEERRSKCQVPDGLKFKTKLEIALELLHSAYKDGWTPKYVGFDSFFGNCQNFLDGLPQGMVYFADVHKDRLVFPSRPTMNKKRYSGRGRRPMYKVPSISSLMVSELVADQSIPWKEVILSIGAKGPIYAKDKCLKVVECIDGQPGKDVFT
jgi:SRSO17 transposase